MLRPSARVARRQHGIDRAGPAALRSPVRVNLNRRNWSGGNAGRFVARGATIDMRERSLGIQAERGAGSHLVGLPDVLVQAGSHLATYFSSEAGRVRIAVPFLREGIELGQPCFLIASGKILERYIKALEKDVKAELARARKRGLIATAPTPGLTVEEALAFWDDQVPAAMSTFSPTILPIVGAM